MRQNSDPKRSFYCKVGRLTFCWGNSFYVSPRYVAGEYDDMTNTIKSV